MTTSGAAVVFERLLGGPPLVPARLRRSVFAVNLLALACLVGFGLAVRNSNRPLLFDRRADSILRRTSGAPHRVALLLSDVGHPPVFLAITAFVAAALILSGDYRAALAALVSVTLAVLLVEAVFKPFFDRRLGDLPGPVFPSGHTLVSVTLAAVLSFAAGSQRPWGQLLGPVRHLLVVIVLAGSCAVGVAMISLQLHYLSDVVAAVPLGLSVSGSTALLLDALAWRWQRSKSPTVQVVK